jgi:sporulation protein YlmC with PRC-barrel domain
MKRLALITTLSLALGSSAMAQPTTAPGTTVAPDSITVTGYYKQNVYDKSDSKIGQIVDVLVGKDGKITGLVIGAGGFLGMGKHDVSVPFSAVKMTKKADSTAANNRSRQNTPRSDNYLVMDTTKDALKNSPGVSYDRTALTWVPEQTRTETTQPSVTRKRR